MGWQADETYADKESMAKLCTTVLRTEEQHPYLLVPVFFCTARLVCAGEYLLSCTRVPCVGFRRYQVLAITNRVDLEEFRTPGTVRYSQWLGIRRLCDGTRLHSINVSLQYKSRERLDRVLCVCPTWRS